MSAVLKKTKKRYQTQIGLEILISSIILLVSLFFLDYKGTLALFFGVVIALIPYCIFVFALFFFENVKNNPKITAFYRSVALKWICSIVLMGCLFLGFKELDYLFFFCGYIVVAIMNGVLPFILKYYVG